MAILLLFSPLLVTGAASCFAYGAITRLRLPASGLIAAGALVLHVTAVVFGFVAATLGGVAFAGTLAAMGRHPASAIVAFLVVPVPYVVFFFALVPIC